MPTPREFLAGLSEEDLLALFHSSNEQAGEEYDRKGSRPIPEVVHDLMEGYTGAARFVLQLTSELSKGPISGPPEAYDWFESGVLAGGMMLLHSLRLAAERDELNQAGLPSSPSE